LDIPVPALALSLIMRNAKLVWTVDHILLCFLGKDKNKNRDLRRLAKEKKGVRQLNIRDIRIKIERHRNKPYTLMMHWLFATLTSCDFHLVFELLYFLALLMFCDIHGVTSFICN